MLQSTTGQWTRIMALAALLLAANGYTQAPGPTKIPVTVSPGHNQAALPDLPDNLTAPFIVRLVITPAAPWRLVSVAPVDASMFTS